MRFEVGDKVKIREDLDYHKDLIAPSMWTYRGQTATITSPETTINHCGVAVRCYKLDIDNSKRDWNVDFLQHATKENKPTDKYKHFNHHHELTDEHEIVDFGDGEFIANKEAIPLLKALNELGLKTRTHHIDKDGGFFSILIKDDMEVIIKKVHEKDATRTKYNGLTEVLISFKRDGKKKVCIYQTDPVECKVDTSDCHSWDDMTQTMMLPLCNDPREYNFPTKTGKICYKGCICVPHDCDRKVPIEEDGDKETDC